MTQSLFEITLAQFSSSLANIYSTPFGPTLDGEIGFRLSEWR